MIKGSFHQECLILKIYAPNSTVPEYIKQTVVIKFIQKETKVMVA